MNAFVAPWRCSQNLASIQLEAVPIPHCPARWSAPPFLVIISGLASSAPEMWLGRRPSAAAGEFLGNESSDSRIRVETTHAVAVKPTSGQDLSSTQ